ncbi:hypothetical protein Catovirus_1_962 [Catovirus CTV1]|uniref:Uncharacterized protein n=1 Tax=Catovirus CTV1 TaxID=1977631 RepID=A0A1V0SB33_9VIRU|nr:hypothetical protein Catovirus_1_962 [Catovirus CTV1]
MIKLTDFDIYNPEQFEKELESLEKTFVLNKNFTKDLYFYLEYELIKRVNCSSYFKKLYSNIKNTTFKTIMEISLVSIVSNMFGVGVINTFYPPHKRNGYNDGFKDGSDYVAYQISNFTKKNIKSNDNKIDLLNYISNIQNTNHSSTTFWNSITGFIKYNLGSILFATGIAHIYSVNTLYDSDTEKLRECLIISKKIFSKK